MDVCLSIKPVNLLGIFMVGAATDACLPFIKYAPVAGACNCGHLTFCGCAGWDGNQLLSRCCCGVGL